MRRTPWCGTTARSPSSTSPRGDPGQGRGRCTAGWGGEQYATATWRTARSACGGLAALTLKRRAAYLKANGFRDAGHPSSAAATAEAGGLRRAGESLEPRLDGQGEQVHTTGASRPRTRASLGRPLHASCPRQPDRVPDSIWTHELWRRHLVGAALRGCHVYAIAPAVANAPSAGFPQLVRTREIFQPLHRGPTHPRSGDRGPGRAPAGRALHRARASTTSAPSSRRCTRRSSATRSSGGVRLPASSIARVGRAAEWVAAAGYVRAGSCPRTRRPVRRRCTARRSSS